MRSVAGEEDGPPTVRDPHGLPGRKGGMREPIYAMARDRTDYFTDEFVRELDARNCERMACLPPWVQRHVVHTYRPKEGKEVQHQDKYFSAVIGGVRKLVQSGLTEDESTRMIELAKKGKRLKYTACTGFGRQGKCIYGDHCRNVRVKGFTG